MVLCRDASPDTDYNPRDLGGATMSAESCGYTANVESWVAGEIRRLEAADKALSNRVEGLYYLVGELTARFDSLVGMETDLFLQPVGESGGEYSPTGEGQDVDG